MWYLIRAAVKNVRINLGQLRNKRKIDSKLCDSTIAAYVQARAPTYPNQCYIVILLKNKFSFTP